MDGVLTRDTSGPLDGSDVIGLVLNGPLDGRAFSLGLRGTCGEQGVGPGWKVGLSESGLGDPRSGAKAKACEL